MKKTFSIVSFIFIVMWGIAFAKDSPQGGKPNGEKISQQVFIDVQDIDHPADKGEGHGVDSLYIEGIIWDQLEILGYRIALSDEAKKNAVLQVICRFKYGRRKPVITPGGGIKMTWINHCSLKFVNKKSGELLFDEEYDWKRDKIDVTLFIKQAFIQLKEKQKKAATSP